MATNRFVNVCFLDETDLSYTARKMYENGELKSKDIDRNHLSDKHLIDKETIVLFNDKCLKCRF